MIAVDPVKVLDILKFNFYDYSPFSKMIQNFSRAQVNYFIYIYSK